MSDASGNEARPTPVFPLGSCLLPGDPVALTVFEDRYLTLVSRVLADDGTFASVLISEGSEVGGRDRRFDVGVLVEIRDVVADGPVVRVRGTATRPWAVTSWHPDDPHPMATGAPAQCPDVAGRERWDVASSLSLVAQAVTSIRSLVAEVAESSWPAAPALAHLSGGRWWSRDVSSEELWDAYWTLARHVPCGALDRHSFLLAGTLPERVRRIRSVATHVEEIARFRLG